MRVHESWREEAGWILILVGFAGFEFGLIDMLFHLPLPNNPTVTMLIMVVSAAMFFAGLGLHVTRPSKREQAIPEGQRDDHDTSHPVQHA